MKVAVITCYNQPDYVRATTLRRAVAAAPGVEMIVVKNRHTGVTRYAEIVARVFWLRLTKRPDAYVLTFRGYEILPFLAIMSWPKPFAYDELVNPIEWLQEPRDKLWPRLIPVRLLTSFYHLLLKRCAVILTDTEAHRRYSAQLSRADQRTFLTVPVCADEEIFGPGEHKPGRKFRVFYYGNMLPLHGLKYVLEAAIRLKGYDIEFLLAGGDAKTRAAIQAAQSSGAHIIHKTWIPFARLAETARDSRLCLGGPFGKTVQARHVVTGKTYQFMASGLPVVVGKTLASELFRDQQNCLMVPLGNALALTDKILWAYQHQDRLESIGRAGQQLYEERYSQKVVNSIVASLLAQL